MTDATPEPSPSSTSAPSETTPATFAPGSWSVTVGGVSSTRTFDRTSETLVLPATSVATARTSYRPSPLPDVSQLVGTVLQVAMPAGEIS